MVSPTSFCASLYYLTVPFCHPYPFFLSTPTKADCSHTFSFLVRRTFIDVKSLIQLGYGILATEWAAAVDCIVVTLLYTMLPRFIISIRELYDRDCHRHCNGTDMGFGISSQPAASENATLSAIAFADVIHGQSESHMVVEGGESEMASSEVVGLSAQP